VSKGLFGRIFGVLDLPVEITDRTGARALAGDRGDVSLRGVGTTTALVGSTGSGMTALVYLVTRLCGPTSVRVCVDGNDLREITPDSLADSVGLVSKETYLFHSSVQDNLRSRPVGAHPRADRCAARGVSHRDRPTGLPVRGRRASADGHRQDPATQPARAHPHEATSALGNNTERSVQAELDRLSAGRTTIAIAHHPLWSNPHRSSCRTRDRLSSGELTGSCFGSTGYTRLVNSSTQHAT
jgi:ATP-binding cassette subfamily B protein